VDVAAFEKGQKVTLTVKIGDQTKVSSELVTSGEDKDKVNFKWETGDKIKVTVGEVPSEFTLKAGAGTNSGTFEGTILGDGDSFEVQYPFNDPDISTQTYSSTEAFPHDMMKFTGSGTTTDFTLTAVNSVLRLNLYGSTAIGSIVVTTNEGTPKTYTLDCNGSGSTGTEPSKTDKPKPFFIVVPAGTYGFTVSVKNASYTQLYSVSTTSGQDKTFVANEILSMKPLGYPGTDEQPIAITTGEPAKTTVWAPVNCGYEPKTGDSGAALGYPYGKLYQWGRKDGQGYNSTDATYPSEDNLATGSISYIPTSSDAEKFYKVTASPENWYSGSSPAANELWKEDGSSIYDPCPEGWRVPTYNELNALIRGNYSPAIVRVGGQNGCYFNGTSSASSGVFLPAAGCRSNGDGSAYYRGNFGYYWSSSVNDNDAWRLDFGSGLAYVSSDIRALGCSVRCVQE